MGITGLLVFAAIILLVIWQLGAVWRAKRTAVETAEYRKIAERAVVSQEATEKRLGEIAEQLAVVSQRVSTMERILKDAE